ncbi:TPA: hypothetical protein ACGD69_002202 [Serratia marcescens]|uniref:hypothetical protein n=1 Tax=Serratia marcescens TaxID=615 RepID=UPI00278F2C07|nr:hypothetical protein [Serratia marcescens]MDP8800913.1 hypothetical protein [Serratia marcescens]
MKLPDRLYYSLDKAAHELGCDFSDIIHYAANGYINLCLKVYSSPIGIEEVSDEWSASLLVNEKYLNEIVAEYYRPYFKDGRYEETEQGIFLAKDNTNFDFVNSYVRLQGRIDFWVEKETGQVEDYSTELYGIYGLLQIDTRAIYANEEALVNGQSIEASSFSLPIDDTHQLANGYFKRHVSEFAHDGWVSDYINKDSEFLRNESVENMVSRNDDKLIVSASNMYVTLDEISRIKNNVPKPLNRGPAIPIESAKTASKKGEIIHALLGLIPEFDNVELESMPVAKIKEIIEVLAAEKGVVFPETHAQTWARYLGRERKAR